MKMKGCLTAIRWVSGFIILLFAPVFLLSKISIANVIALLGWLVAVIILLPVTSEFANKLFKDKLEPAIKIVILISAVFFGVLFGNISDGGKEGNPSQGTTKNTGNNGAIQRSNETGDIIQTPKSEKNYTYKILSSNSQPVLYSVPGHPDWKTQNILTVLLNTNDLSKSNLQKALTEIKAENLTNDAWNVIEAYDNESAYELQKKIDQADKQLDTKTSTELENQYGAEIANHYIASLDNEGGNDFLVYYPFK